MKIVIHMEHLAYNIRIIRGLTKLNQNDFGGMLKVSVAMQKSYESGKAKPDDLYIQRLSQLTQVKEEDIKRKKLLEKDIKVKVEFEENVPSEVTFTSDAGKEIGYIKEELILLKASVRIFGMNIAELLAAKNKTSVTKASLELERTISQEVDRLWLEVNKR